MLDARDEGFVLISVIWIAGLLAVVATAFTIAVRSHTLSASNGVYGVKAEAVADGMALLTAYRLAVETEGGSAPKFNGEPSACLWPDGTPVAVAVQDQGGLVDLNTASPPLLQSLFRGLGVGDDKAEQIIAALQDYRDADSIAASGGEESVVYPGKSYGPKNAPLAVAEEFDQVPELDEALFARLMPLVTVYSQQLGIDPSRAPKPLLDVLGPGDEAVSRFASPSPSKIFGIDVTAELKNGSRYRRQALVALLRQPDRPFAVLAWRRGAGFGESPPLSKGGPPCFN